MNLRFHTKKIITYALFLLVFLVVSVLAGKAMSGSDNLSVQTPKARDLSQPPQVKSLNDVESTHAYTLPIYSKSTYDLKVLSDTPIAYWGMSSENDTEPDLTGNNQTGMYKGGKRSLAKMPNGDTAVTLNGLGEYMSVKSSPDLSISKTGSLTWEAWIRPHDLNFPVSDEGGYVNWMGKCVERAPSCEWSARMYNAINPQGRCSRISAYAFNLSSGLGSGAYIEPLCGQIKPGEWLYVVGEYQTTVTPDHCSADYPGTIDLWVNAVAWNQSGHGNTGCMSEYKVRPRAGSSPFTIGTMALDSWFKGDIGKVAIYNYRLSQEQITSHYLLMQTP